MSEATTVGEIAIDDRGRLLVRPLDAGADDFTCVYRAAMGVSWDSELRALATPMPKEFTYVDWFRQTVAAVAGEYGQRLLVTESTQWSNVPVELREQIKRSSGDGAP